MEIHGNANIDWMYPEIYAPKPSILKLDIYHVRASQGIEIEYSSERDGWVIYRETLLGHTPEGEMLTERREKAFIPAREADYPHLDA